MCVLLLLIKIEPAPQVVLRVILVVFHGCMIGTFLVRIFQQSFIIRTVILLDK